jgi:hypothetical protein
MPVEWRKGQALNGLPLSIMCQISTNVAAENAAQVSLNCVLS